jgi:CCR4-NOT transcription complex subunit 7/8
MVPPQVPDLQVRPVTAANYETELDCIGFLLARYPYVAIDTEYPGTVHRPRPPWMAAERDLSPPERYALVKANVDEIPVVQLGITLCDWFGNVPTFADGDGRQHEVAWEVTFSDFDVHRHRHAPESVAFLQSRGLDFDHARARGVSSAAFAAMLAAVLSSPAWRLEEVTWAAFGGAHDFAYLVKMLAGGRPLPGTWHEFAALAGDLLGGRVFDAKYMAEHCERTDLSGGGLRGVAASLRVRQDLPERPAWLAGRKSYVASRVFTAMRRRVMYRDGGASREGLIDGLHP